MPGRSEAESFSGVSEQRTKTCPIKAQSTAIARAMARICNAERVRFGVVSGHERKTLSLSVVVVPAAGAVDVGHGCRLDGNAQRLAAHNGDGGWSGRGAVRMVM